MESNKNFPTLYLTIILLSFGTIVSGATRKPDDYLLPYKYEARDAAAINWFSESLRTQGIDTPEQVASIVTRTIKAGLESSHADAGPLDDPLGITRVEKTQTTDILNYLMDTVGTLTDDKCFIGSPRRITNLLDVIFKDHNNFKRLVDSNEQPRTDNALFSFLKLFGSSHFELCSSKLTGLFNEKLQYFSRKVEEELDDLFGYQLESPRQDEQLFQVARELDFVSGQYDIRKMYKSIKEKIKDYSDMTSKSTSFKRYLLSKCQELVRSTITAPLNWYNFLRVVMPDEKQAHLSGLPTKMLKLNEYNFLCRQIVNTSVFAEIDKRIELEINQSLARKLMGKLKKNF